MITKKIIISIILLLTYSLGFAHNIIPHQHDSETGFHNHDHTEEHHNHDHSSDSDPEHISHGNHFDEGLYDLIVCFLHETDFHKENCNTEFFIAAKTNRFLTKKNQQQKLVATHFVSTIKIKPATSLFNVANNPISFYRFQLEDNLPLRGPPAKKC